MSIGDAIARRVFWRIVSLVVTVVGLAIAAFLPAPFNYAVGMAVIFGVPILLLVIRLSSGANALPEDAGRELRVGWPAVALGVFALLQYCIVAGTAAPFFLMGLGAGETPPFYVPIVAMAPSALISLGLAAWVWLRVRKVAPGTPGRFRLLVLIWGSVIRPLAYAALATVLSLAMTDPTSLGLGLGLGESMMPVGQTPLLVDSITLVTNAQGTYPFLMVGLVLLAVGLLFDLVGAGLSWFLLPPNVRAWFWGFTDSILIVAFTAVTLLLPMSPPSDAPDAWMLPSLRLAVTALSAARLLFRLIPVALDLVERGNFRFLIAARLLRARKSGFLTTIGALSILAVAFSSCTLTTTLSVMGGFRNDLKSKILGNHAHVVIDREDGTFEGWGPVLDTVREQEDVIAASPYVEGEVMITSATNLAGAVLRGIDPGTIGDVTDLRRNLRHGQLEYLSDPERLLNLRPSEMGRGLLAPPGADDFIDEIVLDPDDPGVGVTGSIVDDIADLTASPEADDGPDDPDSRRIAAEIDEFLAADEEDEEPRDVFADPTPPAEDLLPGLIVGQELARTLRLHVGDEVNVVSPLGELGPTGPMPKSRPFRIAGIFYSGMYEFDMKMAYTTLPAAQGFLNVGEAVSGIEAKIEDTDEAEAVASAIASALGRDELRVRGWQEVNRNLFGALQLEKLAMFITLGIAILVASFCIVGTLTLMVQEKRKEVGILKAMGTSGEQVVAIFMAQGLMIGLLGALMGLGLGYLSCFIMEHFGVHLNPEVYYIDRLPVHIDPAEFVVTGIASVLVCLLATIYPAILGSRLQVTDALRYG